MPNVNTDIAIIGAGIGGLAVAACLRKSRIETVIYEQAQTFARIGSGIQMSPNAVRVLDGIGIGDRLRRTAFEPPHWRNRDWDTGEMSNEYPLGPDAMKRYGVPYLLMHRGDLHAALHQAVPDETIRYAHKLSNIRQTDGRVSLTFENGSTASADAVIASDGVHSPVRDALFGAAAPAFSGRLAYRTTFPTSLLNGYEIADGSVKWWGPDRHIVIYYVTRGRDEIYFTTSQPEPDFQVESWSATGDVGELREAFAGFHPDVRAVLEACPAVNKWAIFERDPLPRWVDGNVVLMGDACHPMTPYMAQGPPTRWKMRPFCRAACRTAERTTSRLPSGVSRPRESREPAGFRRPRIATSSCGRKPIRIGCTATMPGRRRCHNGAYENCDAANRL